MSELSLEYKVRIVESIKENSFKYPTAKSQAISININPAQYSRVINGEIDGVLSDSKWNEIASKYNVPVSAHSFDWQIASTATYEFIYAQLEACQDMSISAMFCDIADLGKSFTAKDYVKRHRNAIYIDCSRNKNRTQLLRAMAKEFGIDHDEPIRVLQKDLIQYMRSMTKPLVILDEFGDLEYPAFLEIKSLWNATEYRCGWYTMGADGLQHKIDRQKALKKVGFAEIFSRFGSRYQRITPVNEADRNQFLLGEIARIVKANNSKYTPTQMFAKSLGSLRRVYIEIVKEKTNLKVTADTVA
ncbi:AAA family ATPase [Seonamhaeicola sp.]|uniref:AAA family ATPase n=1 Tax=Seonamhaeicola sp. TaxID=1912245 RepID=UPI0035616E71